MALSVLYANDIDDIRRAAARGGVDDVLALEPDRISLAAAIELACWCKAAAPDLDPRIVAHVQHWQQTQPILNRALAALMGEKENVPADFATVDREIRSVPASREYSDRSSAWGLFRMRFARALREIGGFDAKLARALSQALNELVDNVLDHGSDPNASPCAGAVGYEVTPGRAYFAVGDIGRGVLESLITNPRYAHLTTARDALHAIVRDRATRRIGVAEGNGIRQVFSSLATLQGELRFRSADAVLTIRGARDFYRVPLNMGRSPPLRGLQISVSCGTHDGEFTHTT